MIRTKSKPGFVGKKSTESCVIKSEPLVFRICGYVTCVDDTHIWVRTYLKNDDILEYKVLISEKYDIDKNGYIEIIATFAQSDNPEYFYLDIKALEIHRQEVNK